MRFLALLSFLLSTALAAQFANPLKTYAGSDPFLTYDNGTYYLLTTTWEDIQITRASTLGGLKTGQTQVIYKQKGGERCCNVWAPEIHKIGGSWFLYFTAGKGGDDLGSQRPFVLKGGNSPWSAYTYAGRLSSEWGIDGTLATIGTTRYFYWSCQRNKLQSLCGAPLLTPTTLGPARLISSPTQAWERKGQFPVNEGPALLQRNGKYYLYYSASQCASPDYVLGKLTLRGGGDPLDAKAWTKDGPVLRSANGNWGPGHNGFFTSPDGKEDWVVYHATSNARGDCYKDRYTLAGKVQWTAAGPVLPAPEKLGNILAGPSGERA